MDGQQRLNAIKEFISNEFRLTNLSILFPINGMSYSDCPPRIRRGLDRAVISTVVLLLESDTEANLGSLSHVTDIRRFIFERLNTGGTHLNPQELRNAIYPGNFNEMIVELSRERLFTDTWRIPPYTQNDYDKNYEDPDRKRNSLYSSMGDCQIILRFFALRRENHIKGAMRNILDSCMRRNQKISRDSALTYKAVYLSRLEVAHRIFNGKPFQLLPDHKGRTKLSVPLHDAIMLAIHRLWNQHQRLLARSAWGFRGRDCDFTPAARNYCGTYSSICSHAALSSSPRRLKLSPPAVGTAPHPGDQHPLSVIRGR